MDINEIDLKGNTALMLATILRRKDCVRVLCDHCADPQFKPFPNCLSPIDYAVAQNDKELLLILMSAVQKAKSNNFDIYKSNLIDSLANMPNMSFKLHLHCESSFIPFVSSFCSF